MEKVLHGQRTASPAKLHVVALEHRKLTADALAQLQTASLAAAQGTSSSEAFRAGTHYPIADVAVIEKCNAVIVVAAMEIDVDEDFARDRLLSAWLDLAPGLVPYSSRIAYYAGRRAIEYLGEVSVGLRSVVLGDSQVFAQVCAGLGSARDAGAQSSPFAMLTRSLKTLLRSVSTNTTLQSGNVSLERVGCERLAAELGPRPATVAVIGLGRTGRLVADVVASETPYGLVVTNRSAQPACAYRQPGVRIVPWGELSFLDEVDAVVFCLASNPDTEAFAHQVLGRLTADRSHQQVVLDMSSPSITRAAGDVVRATIVRIDQLSQNSDDNLAGRQQSVNKAKQIVSEWAEDLDCRLAGSAAQRWLGRTSVGSKLGPTWVDRHRSAMLGAVRDHLARIGYSEIQTPRMPVPVGGHTSQAGLDSWWADGAELRRLARQAGQLMALADLPKVYEIGPSWQLPVQPTPADLFESRTLDVAMRTTASLAELYTLALDLVAAAAGRVSPPGDRLPLVVPAAEDVPVLGYDEVVRLLTEIGHAIRYGAELGFHLNYFLGDLVRRRYGVDIFVVQGFPDAAVRVHPARRADGGCTETFTVVLDGWQVAEGALRETDPTVLRRRLDLRGVRSDRYCQHLDALATAPPHGGFELELDLLLTRVLRCESASEVAPMGVV